MERYKTRLVAKRYTQRPGFDFDSTFSPVAKHTIVCVIISISVTFGWPIHQLDINNAFLQGTLHDIVFM